MGKIKLICFDLDGVLIDMCDNHYKSLNRALKDIVGYEIPYELHLKYYDGISTNSKLTILENRGIIKEDHKKSIWGLKQKYTMDYIDEFNEDIQKIELMKRLKDENYTIGCVSNSIRVSVEMMLKAIGVCDLMDFYLGNEDFAEKIKPNPYPYILAMQKYNVEPSGCMIIEDNEKGLLSAYSSKAHVLEVKNAMEVIYENVKKKLEEIEKN